jgi:putative hemolysin
VIVGEIRDEYDTEEAPIQDIGHGKLLADAAISVHDLSGYLGATIPESPEYESLGGLLVLRAGRVPAVGERLDAFGYSFIVRDADEKRIAKVEILRLANSEMPPSSETSPDSGSKEAPASSKPAPFTD